MATDERIPLGPQQVLARMVGGLPINNGNVRSVAKIRKKSFWHRQAYAAAGATAFTFFNVANTPNATNMPTASALPAGYFFAATSLGIRVVQGLDMAGAAAATGAASALTTAPATLAEQLRLIYSSGNVRFRLNGVDEIDEWGIDAFPTGRGLDGAAAAATTATTTSLAFGIFNNGVPHQSNRREFGPMALGIQPNANFELRIEFPAALPLTGGGIIEAYLDGYLITNPGVA